MSPVYHLTACTTAGHTLALSSNGVGDPHACGSSDLPLVVESKLEVEAWRIALCLMHPLHPTCGKTPASLVIAAAVKPLLDLADKYDLQVC